MECNIFVLYFLKNFTIIYSSIYFQFISIIIWLVLWQIISAIISSPVFLPSPLQTVNALFSLLKTSAYYKSLSYSLLNISIGFFTGLFAGVVLAVAASVNTFLQSVIDVPVKIIRSIPVASFIILALLWVDSAHLSTFIAAITIMPVIYTNTFSVLPIKRNGLSILAPMVSL